ncbi:MAG: hypothetical protein J3K34DRAFT_409354 [Monoraphidium minutum]|nr:MAG: hypothetical protein J3K34DRAFT_409354 [Monoraphidium minutum]
MRLRARAWRAAAAGRGSSRAAPKGGVADRGGGCKDAAEGARHRGRERPMRPGQCNKARGSACGRGGSSNTAQTRNRDVPASAEAPAPAECGCSGAAAAVVRCREPGGRLKAPTVGGEAGAQRCTLRQAGKAPAQIRLWVAWPHSEGLTCIGCTFRPESRRGQAAGA